ncbi:MAG: hypothetical protein KPEEDBHJ_00183 [Anaerolineales bacterium]|nr:hypothetical protein [Anaerolineales bacterium]
MTLTETFALISFSLFSYADLRYRLVPGVEVFLFGTLLLTLPNSPFQTGVVLLACLWGIVHRLSGWFAVPLLFYPPAWPVLMTGYGYRKGIIGRADLIAISGLACLFPLPAVLLALFGLELWRRFWVRRQAGSIPALPGMFVGLLIYIVVGNLF